ncbi:MAG: sulfotransferase [Myxococcales bacterium]|nr:sulfotransferase [Myxococcales bacterium]MDD9971899.1 sulfotransferase [Myxococcales bacterium]
MRLIYVTGSARSGLTLLSDVFSNHRSLGWMSQYYNRFELGPLAELRRLYDLPLIGDYLRVRKSRVRLGGRIVLPYPSEPLAVFGRRHKVTWRTWNDPISDADAARVRDCFEAFCRASKVETVLASMVPPMSMANMLRVFPDMTIFHFIRDGRAAAHSMATKPPHPDPKSECLDERVPAEWLDRWRQGSQSFFGYAIVHWKLQLAQIWDSAEVCGARLHEVHYEDLVDNPVEFIREFCKIADIESDPLVSEYALNHMSPNNNYKWKQAYSEQEVAEADSLIWEERYRQCLERS